MGNNKYKVLIIEDDRNIAGFIQTIGTDYGYPFRNVLEYFEKDDFTIINLESVLADSGYAADKTFNFRGPTAYTNILTGSSVEAVTLANNHTQDYGKDGYDSTLAALSNAGVAYVETNGTLMYRTNRGLTIGVYAACFSINENDMRADIAALRKAGADIVVAAMHWGLEGKYRPNTSQIDYGRMAIDAGADIVYGHHPHVLQKIEEYNGGVIMYSLGNFCFGGNKNPSDKDSMIFTQTFCFENGELLPDEIRLTKFGQFLRSTSIDELPEFINILKGDMSFIGPRPPLTYHPWPIEEYTEEQKKMIAQSEETKNAIVAEAEAYDELNDAKIKQLSQSMSELTYYNKLKG